jgi:hypothetical protein
VGDTKRLWLAVRRAIHMMIAAFDTFFGTSKSDN